MIESRVEMTPLTDFRVCYFHCFPVRLSGLVHESNFGSGLVLELEPVLRERQANFEVVIKSASVLWLAMLCPILQSSR